MNSDCTCILLISILAFLFLFTVCPRCERGELQETKYIRGKAGSEELEQVTVSECDWCAYKDRNVESYEPEVSEKPDSLPQS